ncbi:MAG: 3-hydroxyacyl-ACP dehydratase [Bacteroidota bacterium]
MAPFEEINIPQKPPMVMVGSLVETTEDASTTTFLIREENIFCENGEFREPGLIENMAQTAAARQGTLSAESSGTPPLGFIGGIRNLKISRFPKTGQVIKTRITVLHQVFDATIVHGGIFLEDELIASCELKIFLIKT